jgi:hydrogenase expression/formation protein HypD
MKYVDGFRNPAAAQAIRQRLAEAGRTLAVAGRHATVMEVCGTHTVAIARHGIRDLLPANVRLISGPGCPVCVTAPGYIDAAIQLAQQGAIVLTFGDMIHVPGSVSTLAECRAGGGRIVTCYSPADALAAAERHPDCQTVFLAIGFETTTAPIVSVLDSAIQRKIRNLTMLTAFKLVPPALRALLADPGVRIDAFLCPAHVSAIIGADAYLPFTGPRGVPCVIAGFEPLDILWGLEGILWQICRSQSAVENQYSRVVKPGGNPRALALMEKYLEPADAAWRGIGAIPASALRLRAGFRDYDAEWRHGVKVGPGREVPGCRCGDVLKGKLRPPECPLFGRGCTPDKPIGPCMVSSEGACAASFKYSR